MLSRLSRTNLLRTINRELYSDITNCTRYAPCQVLINGLRGQKQGSLIQQGRYSTNHTSSILLAVCPVVAGSSVEHKYLQYSSAGLL